MLADEQPLRVVQRHIEGVLGAALTAVPVIIVVVIVLLLGGAGVDRVDIAVPGQTAVQPGVGGDLHTLMQAPGRLLADGALDPVGAGLHNGDVGVVTAAVTAIAVAAAVILADRLNDAVHLGEDLGLFDAVLQLLKLRLFLLQVVLRLRFVQLRLLDLEGVAELVGGGCLFLLLLQRLDLSLVVGDAVSDLLHLQLCGGDSQLQRVGVVGKELVARMNLVAYLHITLRHLLVGVLADLDRGPRLHNAAELIAARDVHAHQHGHGLDCGRALVIPSGAARQYKAQRHGQCQGQRQNTVMFHRISSFPPGGAACARRFV